MHYEMMTLSDKSIDTVIKKMLKKIPIDSSIWHEEEEHLSRVKKISFHLKNVRKFSQGSLLSVYKETDHLCISMTEYGSEQLITIPYGASLFLPKKRFFILRIFNADNNPVLNLFSLMNHKNIELEPGIFF